MTTVDKVSITVPLTPASANHYKKPLWSKRRFYVTREAKAYKEAIAIFARGHSVTGYYFRADLAVYLGKGQRLDIDNSLKLIFDGLQEAGVIPNDSRIKDLHVTVDRDWENPRTVIEIEAI